MARAPGFCAATVLSLAIGIGATTAVFAVIDKTLLQPLPYPDAERLIVISTSLSRYLSAPAFRRLLEQNRAVEDLWAAEGREYILHSQGLPELVRGHRISIGAVGLLGMAGKLRPQLGRPFGASDFDSDADSVVLITHRAWVNRFGASPEVVGTDVTLDAFPRRIVGVLPEPFDFFPTSEFLLPLRLDEADSYDEFLRTLEVFGRLPVGSEPAMAQVKLGAFFSTMRPLQRGRVELVSERMVQGFRLTLLTLWLATLLVLLVCCVNFGSLLAARSVARRRELAVRVALGATRARLIRQLLTEATSISMVAGLCGVLLARSTRDTLVAALTVQSVRPSDVPFDWLTIVFATALSIAIGVCFSLHSARRATAARALSRALNDNDSPVSGHLSGRGHLLSRRWLVGSIQVAITTALLVAGGVLLRNLALAQAADIGYRPDDAVTLAYDLPTDRYPTDARASEFIRQLSASIRHLPGVTAVAATSALPLRTPVMQMSSFTLEREPLHTIGRPEPMPPGWPPAPPPPPPPPGRPAVPPSALSFHALSFNVSPGFFAAMGIPVLQGREFDARDLSSSLPVVVVNEVFAQRYWGATSPLGQRIETTRWLTVIGVVGNVMRFPQDSHVRSELYRPFEQTVDLRALVGGIRGERIRRVEFVVRTRVSPDQIARAVAPVVYDIDEKLPLTRVSTLTSEIEAGTAPQRSLLRLFLALSGIALVLTGIGVHGVTSDFVRQRRREMSIRAALGATRQHLLWLAMRDGIAVLAIGLPAGTLLALGGSPRLQQLVQGAVSSDWRVLATVAALLGAVVFSASYAAARRAASADPVTFMKTG